MLDDRLAAFCESGQQRSRSAHSCLLTQRSSLHNGLPGAAVHRSFQGYSVTHRHHGSRPRCRTWAVCIQAATESQVKLRLQHQVAFGEIIKAVGESEVLGAWDPQAAPALEWGDGDVWSLVLGMEPGSYVFKCVVVREDGSLVAWQPAENRVIEVPGQAAPGVLEVEFRWDDPTVTSLVSQDDDEQEEMEDFPVEESAPPELGAAPERDEEASTVPGEGEKVGEMVSVDEADIEADRADEVRDVTPGSLQGEAEAAQAEDAAEEREQPQATSASSPQSVPSEPPWARVDYSSTALPSGGPSSSSASESVSAGGAASGEVSVGAQWTAIVLGSVAIPVVAWSEFTLKTTGCGLPPGPSGLLGAAEGVSYLVLVGLAAWSLATKLSKGKGLPPGPVGLLGAVEGLTYATLAAGLVVLGLQVKDRGFVPSALPDANCYGEVTNTRSVAAVPEQLLGLVGSASDELGNQLQQASTSTIEAVQSATESAAKMAKDMQERTAADAAKSQQYVEETYAGALDGISGADLSSVVEELQGAASALQQALLRARDSLTGMDLAPLVGQVQRAVAQVQQQASALSSGLPKALAAEAVERVSEAEKPDLAPVLSNLEKVTSQLQSTLSNLSQAASSIKETSSIVPSGSSASGTAPPSTPLADNELKQATIDASAQDAVEAVTKAGPGPETGATAAQIAGVDTQTPDVPAPPVLKSARPDNPAPDMKE
ncbi:hypothetical protein WJX72_006264 [[Myrmecia] bisecta]|uniref:CBM20 domain-containing protein n=1 Tax=[Myrmecia] bisecta TaxID=41462 RepID=A0AAW1P468_9CHLO